APGTVRRAVGRLACCRPLSWTCAECNEARNDAGSDTGCRSRKASLCQALVHRPVDAAARDPAGAGRPPAVVRRRSLLLAGRHAPGLGVFGPAGALGLAGPE